MSEIGVEELKEKFEDFRVIDVRTKREWDKGRIEGAEHVPMREVVEMFARGELDLTGQVVRTVERLSQEKGLPLGKVYNLEGGILEW